MAKQVLVVEGTQIAVVPVNGERYVSISNPNFNSLEFEGIGNEAGLNRLTISVKQAERHGTPHAAATAQLQSLLNSSAIKRLK